MKLKNLLAGAAAAALLLGSGTSAFALQDYHQYLLDDEDIPEYRFETHKPNAVSAIKTIPGGEVTRVEVNSSNCGIVVEKGSGKNFKLDYVGVDDQDLFEVSAAVDRYGKLTISVEADEDLDYVSVPKGYQVNVVRLTIPDKEYQNFAVNDAGGVVYLPDINSTVQISSDEGTVRVDAEQMLHSRLYIEGKAAQVLLNADGFLDNADIALTDHRSMIRLRLREAPENLTINTSGCIGDRDFPDGYKRYRTTIGDGTPVLTLSNEGETYIAEYNF